MDSIRDVKRKKNEMFNKYIDSHVQIAYAKADIMIIEENKNSLFGMRENVVYALNTTHACFVTAADAAAVCVLTTSGSPLQAHGR